MARRGTFYVLGAHRESWGDSDAEIAFYFERASDYGAPVVLKVPRSTGLGGEPPGATVGEPTVTCRGGRVDTAWAVSSWEFGEQGRWTRMADIDHAGDVHELHRARCSPRGCEQATVVLRHIGAQLVGADSPYALLVEPPFVADLGTAAVVVWEVGGREGLLVRAAPFEALDRAETRVLALDEEGDYLLNDARPRPDELMLLVTRRGQSETLRFRADAEGAISLVTEAGSHDGLPSATQGVFAIACNTPCAGPLATLTVYRDDQGRIGIVRLAGDPATCADSEPRFFGPDGSERPADVAKPQAAKLREREKMLCRQVKH